MTGRMRVAALAAGAVLSALSLFADARRAAFQTIRVGSGDSLRIACETIRARTPSDRRRGVEVLFAPGRYRLANGLALDASASGVPGAEVVFRAEKPGTVFLTTAAEIPAKDFKPWKGGILAAPLPKDVSTKDWQRRGEQMNAPFPDLYVDGKAMTVAQWPNAGWTNIAFFVDEGSYCNDGSVPVPRKGRKRGGIFGYSGDRPQRWMQERNLWVEGYWCWDWFSSCIRVKDINVASNTIELASESVYGVRPGNPSPRRWRARNVLAELDAPGEFYVDEATRKVYLMPPKGFNQASSRVVFSSSESVLLGAKGLHDVRFENLVFEDVRWSIAWCECCTNVVFRRSTFRNGHSKGIVFRDAGGCRVESCDFFDLGTGGIVLGGGDRRTLEPGRNVVEDCLFRRCSQHSLTSAPAVDYACGVGNVVRHCEITDQPHQGVHFDGNDCVYEYNVLSNVCYRADDAGGLYGGRKPGCHGNVIRHSLFRDIRSRLKPLPGSKRQVSMEGIYFDDFQGGMTVVGCVFVNAGQSGPSGTSAAVYTNGGWSNRVENCIFVDCIRAVGCTLCNSGWWRSIVNRSYRENERELETDYFGLRQIGGIDALTNGVYAVRYPDLKGYFTAYESEKTRQNVAVNNVAVDCREFTHTNRPGWVTGPSNLMLNGDVGFVNRAGGNFALKPDSKVYRRLPDFKPIPFEKIGLLRKR